MKRYLISIASSLLLVSSITSNAVSAATIQWESVGNKSFMIPGNQVPLKIRITIEKGTITFRNSGSNCDGLIYTATSTSSACTIQPYSLARFENFDPASFVKSSGYYEILE